MVNKRQENEAEQGKSNKFHSRSNNDLAKIKLGRKKSKSKFTRKQSSNTNWRPLSICNVPDYTVRATVADLVNE